MRKVVFKCPECGSNRLEEIMTNAVVSTDVRSIEFDNGTAVADYGDSTTADGEVDRYQCGECGYVLLLDERQLDCSKACSLSEVGVWVDEHMGV